MNLEEKEAFYDRVAEALGMEHEFRTPNRRRTRWNNRKLGNGRFPGFGLVRVHGSMIQVISRYGSPSFSNPEDAIAWLRDLHHQPSVPDLE